MSIFFPKMRKPRGFNYQPRYWDPEKERKELREKRIKKEMGLLDEKEYVPDAIEKAYANFSERKKEEKKSEGRSNFILIILIVILLSIAYYFIR